MKLAPLEGIALDLSGLLSEMRRLADYIFFDGPLLSHFRGPHGTSYFRHWCDVDNSQHRWMVFEVTEKDRLSYLDGRKSLRELILNSENLFVYFIDTDEEGDVAGAMLVPIQNIPEDYIPEPNSFYEFEPVNVTDEERQSYTILIDDKWSLEDLGEFRRLYERSYSFLYALKEMFPEGERLASLKHTFGSLPWKGGFSAMHFFGQITHVIPRERRASVKSMQYASPGWIELELSRPVALLLRSMVYNAMEKREGLSMEIDLIHDVLRARNLLGNSGKAVQDNLSQEDIQITKRLYFDFCKGVEFPLQQELLAATPNPLGALKILISFTRRLWNLVDFGLGHKVQL